MAAAIIATGGQTSAQPTAGASPAATTAVDSGMVELAEKLGRLRDEIFAGTHTRFKLPPHIKAGAAAEGAKIEPIVTALTSKSQFLPTPAQRHASFGSSLPPKPNVRVPPPISFPSFPPHSVSFDHASSSIIPKPASQSVAASTSVAQRRNDLERVLAEQIQQKRAITKFKTCDQEIVADFDVSAMLQKAQEVAPPTKRTHDPAASSKSDSFDDKTFYSSQMNESTSTEEAETTKVWRRPMRACRFFRDGKPCPYGDKCTFSHDPAILRKPHDAEDSARAVDRSDEHRQQRRDSPKAVAAAPAQDAQALRIAALEEQLRQMKAQQQTASKPAIVPRAIERAPAASTRHDSGRPEDGPVPEKQNYAHIIRNRVSSPYAPQPARISPMFQHQHIASTDSASKKRRRYEPEQPGRNVVPRREAASPAVHIKQEPVSPVYQVDPTIVDTRQEPIYVDLPSPTQQARPIYRQQSHYDPGQHIMAAPPTIPRVRPQSSLHVRRAASTRHMPPPPPLESFDGANSNAPRLIRAVSQAQPSSYRTRLPQANSFARQASVAMASPQSIPSTPSRRIVVDQYGNRFIEATVPVERAMSAIPAYHEQPQQQYYTDDIRPTLQPPPQYLQHPQYQVLDHQQGSYTAAPPAFDPARPIARAVRHVSLMPHAPQPFESSITKPGIADDNSSDGRYLQYAPMEEQGRYSQMYR